MNEVAEQRSKGADEKFCSDCGGTIKAKAEICPKCGIRQSAAPGAFNAQLQMEKARLQRHYSLFT